jgi:hypothetical protein
MASDPRRTPVAGADEQQSPQKATTSKVLVRGSVPVASTLQVPPGDTWAVSTSPVENVTSTECREDPPRREPEMTDPFVVTDGVAMPIRGSQSGQILKTCSNSGEAE